MHISIDDFGTRSPSLSYLKQLPVECLKIDRAFVDGLDKSTESAAIVKAVIALADALGLVCIAEGVETERQRQILGDLGCTCWPRASCSAGCCWLNFWLRTRPTTFGSGMRL